MPIEKSKPATEESETRLLSCSNKMNLVLEKQIVFWLMQCVRQKLDPDQFDGVKGNSISHDLIEMTNLILYNQNMKDPVSTIGVYLDYKQGSIVANIQYLLKFFSVITTYLDGS